MESVHVKSSWVNVLHRKASETMTSEPGEGAGWALQEIAEKRHIVTEQPHCQTNQSTDNCSIKTYLIEKCIWKELRANGKIRIFLQTLSVKDHHPETTSECNRSEQISITLQNTVPCSYQHFSGEKGIPAEAQRQHPAWGWIPKVTFKQSENLTDAETWNVAQSTTLGWQKHMDNAHADLCLGAAVRGGGTCHSHISPLLSLQKHCGISSPQLQLHCTDCKDSVHPRKYRSIHCGWKQLKISPLMLQLHLIISHGNQSNWLSGHLPCRGSAVQGVPRLGCFWWKLLAITKFLENVWFQESSTFWLETQCRATRFCRWGIQGTGHDFH